MLQKKQLFEESPICNSSGCPIKKWEEADFYNGKIYHRAFSPKLGMVVDPSTNKENKDKNKKPIVQIIWQGNELEFDDIREALEFVVDLIANKIIDDPHDISRLSELDCVGEPDELLSTIIKGKKHIKKFGKLENIEGDQLYINVGGNRMENIAKIKQLASLFSFMSDFEIIN